MAKTQKKSTTAPAPKEKAAPVVDTRKVVVQEFHEGKWVEIDECSEPSCRKAKKSIRGHKNPDVQAELSNPRRRIRRKRTVR